MTILAAIALAVLSEPPNGIDFDSLPPFAASREVVEPILKATGRDLPNEREWEYLKYHFSSSSRTPLRDAAITALDRSWVERCDLAAQKTFGRNASSGELLVWQTYGFACHDAALTARTVQKRHGGKPLRAKGKVVDDKSGEPLKGVRVFGQWPDVASTDADGGFEIETGRDYDGKSTLVFEMEGKAKELLLIPADGGVEAASIRMTPEVEFAGEVIGRDNKAIDRAGVSVSASTNTYRERLYFGATTDVDGRFRLAGWGNPRLKRRYLSIEALGHEGFGQEVADAAAGGGQGQKPLHTFNLKPALDVAGQVVDQAGNPVAAVDVQIRSPGSSGYSGRTLSDHDGRFRMNITAGPWFVVAEKCGLALGHVRIDLAEESKRDLRIVIPSNGAYIEGKALLPDGKPAVNCSIGWVRRASKANGSGDQWNDELGSNHHTVTDEEGRFRVGPFDPKEGYEVMGLVDPPRMSGKVIAKPGDADVVIQLAKEGR